MKPENFDIQDLIDNLQGTCKSLADGCKDFNFKEDDLTPKDHNEIDNQIFLCEECGWWDEISSQTEDGICEDCNEF